MTMDRLSKGMAQKILTFCNSIYYYGFKYQCSLCGCHLRLFLPTGENNHAAMNQIGGGYRFACCPVCRSLDRERLVYWYLKYNTRLLTTKEHIKILHVAPENNLATKMKSNKNLQYISGNIDPHDADIAVDIEQTCFPDNSFDIIICNHVLGEVTDDQRSMRELFRILKSGGWSILQVAINTLQYATYENPSVVTIEDRIKHYGNKEHHRIHGHDYKERLESHGFTVELYDIKRDLDVNRIQKFGINPQELIYVCYKPNNMNIKWSIRKFTNNDMTGIADLRNKHWGPNATGRSSNEIYFSWKYLNNSSGRGEMLIAEEQGNIIGMIGLTSKIMRVKGLLIAGAELTDAFTQPEYQGKGILSSLFTNGREMDGFDKGRDFVYALPNSRILPVYLKLGYCVVSIKFVNMSRLICPDALIRRHLPQNPLSNIICASLRYVSHLFYIGWDRDIRDSDILIFEDTIIPSDIDTLFCNMGHRYDVIIVRDRNYLTWRYMLGPDKYSWLTARNNKGEIIGYMVTRVSTSNPAIGFVCDFLTVEDDERRTFKALLRRALWGFRQKNVGWALTRVIDNSFYYGALLSNGFFRNGAEPIICFHNEMSKRVIEDKYTWHLTMGDSDHI